jgi:small subunit ribosomal protein S7
MSRRSRPEKPEIPPDPRFNSTHVQSFINRVMKDGKKSVAASTIYAA